MNVLIVSQCDKRALTETRRILDQFAERRGERTWQTPITQAGLDTLRKLLRKTARKNTAVACHWIRGLDHSELLWIVGDASRFNAEGVVPTDTTVHDILRSEDENDWHTAEDIRLLAQLAALLHDLGKASIAFQQRLLGQLQTRNLYRHEWVSLRLFEAFVGSDDDEGWLNRLAENAYDENTWTSRERYHRDKIDEGVARPFSHSPPLASAIGWLVVTHHRLPLAPARNADGEQEWLGRRPNEFSPTLLETPLFLVEHDWNERHTPTDPKNIQSYWDLAGPLPTIQPKWQAKASKLAKRLLQLRTRRDGVWLDKPYVMHLARLSLMLADHYYSALPRESALRVQGDKGYPLFANTDSKGLKQALDEHLIGVARDSGLITHSLPGFERHLPHLMNHRGLRKRTSAARFNWQNKAADAAAALRETAREHGAFIVNMASTGCGKTLANARILYALADPQRGMRATYTLGLRTLTLQTGRSYRKDLHLDEEDLAILVGGSANRSLFEFYERQAERTGSASTQALLEEDSHVRYEGNVSSHPLLSRALTDDNIRKLLSAPMLVCTIDHIVPATESLRAGRQIAPMLRLMSSDLILDELDDYDLNDFPALTRLVHWAGMLGTRVVLSSATLPPALVAGMYQAYRAGRLEYERHHGNPGERAGNRAAIPCLWTDEFGVHSARCADDQDYARQHARFIDRRAAKLAEAEPLRRGELLPLSLTQRRPGEIHAEFAHHVLDACLRLHADHAETCPVSGRRVSFGLVRMANIDPLFDTAKTLFELNVPEDTRIHLCVYHARFPLAQRSAIEHQLDTALNRRQQDAVYRLPDIRAAIDTHAEHNHIFVVLASPVCEVGRDWDADWAVAEPSSMRSLIQLAGRVQRHRAKTGDKPNILIFDTNLRHYRYFGKDAPAFIRPGFEKNEKLCGSKFRLETHRLEKLLAREEYDTIGALPRIRPKPAADRHSTQRLVDLEHERMDACMLPKLDLDSAPESDESAYAWLYPQAALTGILPQMQPFRNQALHTTALAFLPDDDEERLVLHRIEETPTQRNDKLYIEINDSLCRNISLQPGQRISPWGKFDLMSLLAEQAEYLDQPLRTCAERMATVEVPNNGREKGEWKGWRYHPWLGFASDK
jgi:CRISPR-associated endonuclease/helicase Cas3